MNLAMDVETEGLSGELIVACIARESRTHKFFYEKKEIWEYFEKLATSEARRGKTVTVYAYFTKFDFLKIVDWNRKGIKIKSMNPFIAEYTFNCTKSKRKGPNAGKATIFFCDIWNVLRVPLKEAARMIGQEKLEMPEGLKNNGNICMNEVEKYNLKDTLLVIDLFKRIQEELKEMDVRTKRIISVGQLAINTFLKWCKERNYTEIFEIEHKNQLVKPKAPEITHLAYRYGRTQLKRENFESVYHIDINSLYPFVATKMPFPDLKSEKVIKNTHDKLSLEGCHNLIKNYPIGVSKVIIKTPDNYNGTQYGVLVTRINNKMYFPCQKDKYISGTYTHIELQKAIEEGYKLLHIQDSVIYPNTIANPFTEYFKELYHLRKNKDEFSNKFWKNMANYLIGKFGQRKDRKIYLMDSIMKVDDYLKDGYEVLHAHKENYMYYKKIKQVNVKHYNPIIPIMVNAWAKLYHYEHLKKIPYKDFAYCDTDNIVFTNEKNLDKFTISDKFGDFGIEKAGVKLKVYNKKTYLEDNVIKFSGMKKKLNEKERLADAKSFEQGFISYPRMVSFRQAKNLEEVGTFTEINVDLHEGMINSIINEEDVREQRVYLDQREKHNAKKIVELIEKEELQ